MKHSRYFLDINPTHASDPASPYAVLPLPYERTVTYGTGTRHGPSAILTASKAVELFDEELRIPVDLAVQTLPAPQFGKLTDDSAMSLIRRISAPLFSGGRFVLSLGGEHTVTPPLVLSAAQVYPDLSVLQFDAHLDLRDSHNGIAHSHACAMHRIFEAGIPVVHVGIRSCSKKEYDLVERKRLPVFWAQNIRNGSAWMSKAVNLLSRNVYISFDIDALDPAFVPGTGTPEPGGMSWYQVLDLLKKVFKMKNVVSADIVEVAPFRGSQVSEFTAARLAAKMLMYHKHRKLL